MSGTLVRRFKKDNALTFLDWDLRNQVTRRAGGQWDICHIEVPGVCERVVKWFGVMRPTDCRVPIGGGQRSDENDMKTMMQRTTPAFRPGVRGAAHPVRPAHAGNPGPGRFGRGRTAADLTLGRAAPDGAWPIPRPSAGWRACSATWRAWPTRARQKWPSPRAAGSKGPASRANSFGLGQRVGSTGALGISVMSMGFGDLPVNTTDQPEGGLGTFRVSYANISVAYEGFSNSIYGGLLVRVVSESIADARASGVCFDAGINYVTGRDQVRFAIALKNVGPTMRFDGDGMAVQGLLASGSDQLTLANRSQKFELPSMLSIGGSYDFKLGEMHRLTPALSFFSNSFTRDQLAIRN